MYHDTPDGKLVSFLRKCNKYQLFVSNTQLQKSNVESREIRDPIPGQKLSRQQNPDLQQQSVLQSRIFTRELRRTKKFCNIFLAQHQKFYHVFTTSKILSRF